MDMSEFTMIRYETGSKNMGKKIKKTTSKFHHYFRVLLIIFTITFGISAVIFGVTMSGIFNITGETVVLSNEMYTLKGNPTSYEKEVFKELTAEIESSEPDDRVIAGLVVKNFIADYYTWSNKSGGFDVGGRNYVFYMENLNFTQTSRRYYQYEMSKYLANGIEASQLQTVNDITIMFADHGNGYDYKGKIYDSYYVMANWTYAENEFIDTSVFPTFAEFTLVKTEEGRYEIAWFY